MCAPILTPWATARSQVARMIDGSPAWNPQAMLALVTTASRAVSSPCVQVPKPSPRSRLMSHRMMAPRDVMDLRLIGDEHVSGRVADRVGDTGGHDRGLRGDPARPEHRDVTVGEHDGITELRAIDSVDQQGVGITDMDRRP